jgi:hypothetical protein
LQNQSLLPVLPPQRVSPSDCYTRKPVHHRLLRYAKVPCMDFRFCQEGRVPRLKGM